MSAVQDQFKHVESSTVEKLFNSPSYKPDGIGLCLSGGGYKAAAYHLGGLIRLNQLGLLPKINRIASVSGGSIAAGFLGFVWGKLTFANGVATNFAEVFVEPLKEFLTEVNLDVPEGVLGLLLPFRSGADGVDEGYNDHLFDGATLQDLPTPVPGSVPEFVLLATNYELNNLWRFSKPHARNYRVGEIKHPTFKLSRIVAASSAFPPFFCPLKLTFAGQTVDDLPGTDRHKDHFLKEAELCDGGIYDNMGVEPIWKEYGTLLVSNAGDFVSEGPLPGEWFSLMLRIIGMVHRQAENNRVRPLMLLAGLKERTVAYWPLRNTKADYPAATQSPLTMSPADVEAAQKEPVRLWSLGNKAFARLVNHGYIVADSATRSYLTLTSPLPPSTLPF